MLISKNDEYLLVEFDLSSQKQYIKILPSLEEALTDWDYLNRISPIFNIKFKEGLGNDSKELFKKKCTLFFAGPINPASINKEILLKTKVWLSFGLYNTIIYTSTKDQSTKIDEGLTSLGVDFEKWDIIKNEISRITISLNRNEEAQAKIKERPTIKYKYNALKSCSAEYSALIASTLTRAAIKAPKILPDLLKFNEFIVDVTQNDVSDTKSVYDMFGIITVINASLSRFSSQIFTGISPILQTECHVWSHSLLGIGIANLALTEVLKFITDTIGELRIPQLFELYSKEPVVDISKLRINDAYWKIDHLTKIYEKEENKEDIRKIKKEILAPIITYFSGRDGFRSHHNTLSVPLESLGSSTTSEWSIITITHEISHSVVRGVLSSIMPDFSNDTQVLDAWNLISPDSVPRNQLEMIRKFLFLGISDIEKCSTDRINEDLIIRDEASFAEILDKWYRDVDEVMAHIFDFLYFFGEREVEYINEIWTSWSVIPNIRNRVKEYVLRTLCALLSINLNKGASAEEVVKKILSDGLEDLIEKNPDTQYIKDAYAYLNNSWDIELKKNLIARKNIIKLVRTFLYSEDLGAKVFGEKWISLNSTKSNMYDLKLRELSNGPISNPLFFISEFSNSKNPSTAESLWIFNTIVFNYEN